MAFVVPALAAIGGSAGVAGGALVVASAAAGIGGGLMSAQASKNAGKAAQQQADAEGKQEADASRGREIVRRRDLLRALSSQNAAAGAGGVSVTGGFAAAASRDVRDSRDDLLIDKVNSGRRIGILKSSGANARSQGNVAAVGSLLDTVSNTGRSLL